MLILELQGVGRRFRIGMGKQSRIQRRNELARANRGVRPGKLIEPKRFTPATDLALRVENAPALSQVPDSARKRVRFTPQSKP
jgi:hypothetical protein